MVLLDYIANQGLRLPREGSSDRGAVGAPARGGRAAVGVGAVFPPATRRRSSTTTRRSCAPAIPAVDLIDFSYRYADGLKDTIDKLSVRSLDAVGETVVDYLRRR